MKLLTLNLHKGLSVFNRRFVLPAIREAIKAAKADVVFLQEVVGEHQGMRGRHAEWPIESQYEYLADTVWTEYAYGKNAATDASHHGNAVLSRFPIQSWRNHDVSVPNSEQRGLLHCELACASARRTLHTICVHLGLKERHRQHQLDELCRLVDQAVPSDAPLIISGDFNDWRSRADKRLRRKLGVTEAFADNTGKPARTFPSWLPLLPLDRIYMRNVKLVDAQVLNGAPWSRLSDHAALTAEIEL